MITLHWSELGLAVLMFFMLGMYVHSYFVFLDEHYNGE